MALFAVILVGVATAVSWGAGWPGWGAHSPLPVTRVPSVLPERGVQLVNGAIVLTPWEAAHRGAMSEQKAITAARHFSRRPALPATALKVEITLPHGWPPGTTSTSGSAGRPIDHVPVWLVTFTSPRPVDVSGGGLIPFFVTQFSEAVNPVSGKLVLGFETPARQG